MPHFLPRKSQIVLAVCSAWMIVGGWALGGGWALSGGDPALADRRKLQGTWVMHALEINGKLATPEEIADTTVVIDGDLYSVSTRGQVRPCTFRIDAAKNPKEIDMFFKTPGDNPKIFKGIYRFEGETLHICRGVVADKTRPTQFGTWPDTGVFMVSWKRK